MFECPVEVFISDNLQKVDATHTVLAALSSFLLTNPYMYFQPLEFDLRVCKFDQLSSGDSDQYTLTKYVHFSKLSLN